MTEDRARAAVFEDTPANLEELKRHLEPSLAAFGVDLATYDGTMRVENLGGKGLSDHVTKFLETPRPATAVLLDWELSQYAHSVERVFVEGLCEELGIPVCLYETQHGPREKTERMMQWQDNLITLDSFLPLDEVASRYTGVVRGFRTIEQTFRRLEQESLGKRLREVLHAPDSAAVQIEQYSWGQTSGLQLAARKDPTRFAIMLTGYWIYNRLLQFPGVLLNPVAASSYLGLDVREFTTKRELQEPFKKALYAGPFAELGPYWWTSQIEELLAESAKPEDKQIPSGHTVLSRLGHSVKPVKCYKGHEGAGYYCVVLREPICAEHSAQPSGWLPLGADRCRIEQEMYDRLSPWLKL